MPPLVLIIITAVVFVAVLMVVGLLYWWSRSNRLSRAQQLARRLGTHNAEAAPSQIIQATQGESLSSALGSLGDYLEGLTLQADVEYDVGGLLKRAAGAALIGLVIGLVLTHSFLGLLGLGAGLLPIFWLARLARKRADALSSQLPDALDLIARSLQAGHGLSDAMRLCAEEMTPPVAMEFGRVYEEHNLGRDLRDCLDNLSQRNPRSFDLKIFVSSVMLQRDTGGNLIEILENISTTIRDRFVFHAKVRALTAETRMSAMILGGLPFALALLIRIVRPDYLDPLFYDPLGQKVFMGALGWFGFGVLLMRKLTQVEV